MAPEILKKSYDEKCDIFSCGVILYILLCGYPPFNGRSDREIFNAIKKGIFFFPDEDWNETSEEAKDLISKMLIIDPKKRFSAEECLSHPWFNIYDNLSNYKINKNALIRMKKFKVNIIIIIL